MLKFNFGLRPDVRLDFKRLRSRFHLQFDWTSNSWLGDVISNKNNAVIDVNRRHTDVTDDYTVVHCSVNDQASPVVINSQFPTQHRHCLLNEMKCLVQWKNVMVKLCIVTILSAYSNAESLEVLIMLFTYGILSLSHIVIDVHHIHIFILASNTRSV